MEVLKGEQLGGHQDGIGRLIIGDSYADGEDGLASQRLSLGLQPEGYAIIHQSPWIESGVVDPEATGQPVWTGRRRTCLFLQRCTVQRVQF